MQKHFPVINASVSPDSTVSPDTPVFLDTSVSRALERTSRLIERFGGRLAGTPACEQTAQALRDELDGLCPGAKLESFTTRPGTFTGFYRIDVVLYLLGLALLFMGLPLPAGLLLLFMITAAGLQFGYYIELYDRFYPPRTCHNLTASLEPRWAVTRQLIFSGHHDSANELKFLRKHQKLYGLKIIVPDAFRMLAMVFAWVWVGWQIISGARPPFTPWILALLVIGIYPVFTKFFAFAPWPVPGAGDNLIASSMLLELADLLRDQQRPGSSVLAHTRLIFASFDAEEAGLRGARAWVKAHRAELDALPTFALNIDSIYSAADLAFLTSDLNSHVPLDRALAEQCARLAQTTTLVGAAGSAALAPRLVPMRFGGGGTDATELARVGVHATTMIAMPAGVIRDGLVYHTMQDTVEAIEPQAVAACLSVAYHLACELDQ